MEEFEDTKWQYVSQLVLDPDFQELIRSSKVLNGQISADLLLEDPKYLSALLIYLHSQKLEIPQYLKDLIGSKSLPSLNYYWMEVLLQGVLYQTPDWYQASPDYIKEIERDMKARGLLKNVRSFWSNPRPMTKSSINL